MMKAGRLYIAIIPCLALTATLIAQSREPSSSKLPIAGMSNHGGYVNFATGSAEGIGRDGATRPLEAESTVDNGEIVQVGDAGRLELLLNPGYYLRLNSGARVRLVDLATNNLRIDLLAGAAIIEVVI